MLSTPFPSPPSCQAPSFRALDTADVLRDEALTIDRIKICFALGSANFERDVVPLIHRHAAYVHQLPYTPDAEFSEPGGLLRLGLRTAYFALQGSDAHIFSGRATISQRQLAEPRWRMATFIAGLCSELHRPLSRLEAVNDQGEVWPSCVMPLLDWLKKNGNDRYTLRWRTVRHEIRAIGLFALPHIAPASVMQDLATGHPAIVQHMLASIAGNASRHEHNVVGALVARALALVVESELNAKAEQTGKRPPGSHRLRYLLECMRQLAATNGGWAANAEKSRVWHATDGLFVAWPSAAVDIGKQLDTDLLSGISREPGAILAALAESGVAVAQTEQGPLWRIQPPNAKAPLVAIKLASAGLLYDCDESIPAALPTPLAIPIAPPAPLEPLAVPEPAAPHAVTAPIGPPSTSPAFAPKPAPKADPANESDALPQSDLFSESTRPADSPSLRIKAPLRLPQPLRMALQHLGTTLPTRQLEQGLFLPLSEFSAHGVEPSVALRSLADAGMLETAAAQGTAARLTWTLPGADGKEVLGIVIATRFLEGDAPRSEAQRTT